MPECTKCHQPVLVTESTLCGPCDRKAKAIILAIQMKMAQVPVRPRNQVKQLKCTQCRLLQHPKFFDAQLPSKPAVCRKCITKGLHDQATIEQTWIKSRQKKVQPIIQPSPVAKQIPRGNWMLPKQEVGSFVFMPEGRFVCEKCKTPKRQKNFLLNGDGSRLNWCKPCQWRETYRFGDTTRKKKKKGPNTAKGKPKVKKHHQKPLPLRNDHEKYAIVTGDSQYNGMSYASRNLTLTLMGFANYGDYLNSDLWWDIRTNVLHIKGTRCSLCPAKADQVHHNRYHLEDLLGRNLEHLHPICDDCHEHIEFGPGRVKRHLHEVRAVFCGMLEMNTKSIT